MDLTPGAKASTAAGRWTSRATSSPFSAPIATSATDAKKTKNGLRLDVRAAALKGGDTGPAIEPGNSEHSLIVRRLLGLDGEDQMPKDKDPLDAAQIAIDSTLDRSGRSLAGHC